MFAFDPTRVLATHRICVKTAVQFPSPWYTVSIAHLLWFPMRPSVRSIWIHLRDLYDLLTTYHPDRVPLRVEHEASEDLLRFWIPLVHAIDASYGWKTTTSFDRRIERARYELERMHLRLVRIEGRACEDPRPIHRTVVDAWRKGTTACDALIDAYEGWDVRTPYVRPFTLDRFSEFETHVKETRMVRPSRAWSDACEGLIRLRAFLVREPTGLFWSPVDRSVDAFDRVACPVLVSRWMDLDPRAPDPPSIPTRTRAFLRRHVRYLIHMGTIVPSGSERRDIETCSNLWTTLLDACA